MKKIAINTKTGTEIINTHDLSYISAEGEKYCWFVMTYGKKKLMHISFSELYLILPAPPFYQVNESSIIHIEQVKKLITDNYPQIVLCSGVCLPISIQLIDQLFQ